MFLYSVFRQPDHEGEVWFVAGGGPDGDQSAQHPPHDGADGRPPAHIPGHPGHAQRQVPGRRPHPLHRSGQLQLGRQKTGEKVSHSVMV